MTRSACAPSCCPRLLIRVATSLAHLARHARVLALTSDEKRLAEAVTWLEQGESAVVVAGEARPGDPPCDPGAATLAKVARIARDAGERLLAMLAPAIARSERREARRVARFERRLAALLAIQAEIDERAAGIGERTRQCAFRVQQAIGRGRRAIPEAAGHAMAGVSLTDAHLVDRQARELVLRRALETAVQPLIAATQSELATAITDWVHAEDLAVAAIVRRLDAVVGGRKKVGEAVASGVSASSNGCAVGVASLLGKPVLTTLAGLLQDFEGRLQPPGRVLAESVLPVAGATLIKGAERAGWRAVCGWMAKDGVVEADQRWQENCRRTAESLRCAYGIETRAQIDALFDVIALENRAQAAVMVLGEGVAATLAREAAHVGQVVAWCRSALRLEREQEQAAHQWQLRSYHEMQSEIGQLVGRLAGDAHAFAQVAAATEKPLQAAGSRAARDAS